MHDTLGWTTRDLSSGGDWIKIDKIGPGMIVIHDKCPLYHTSAILMRKRKVPTHAIVK